MKTYAHLWLYVAEFFLEWKIFHTTLADESKTDIMFNNPPPKIVSFMK
jgi:hypothetical protein